MQRALGEGHISGDGPFTRQCHALLERIHGGGRALLTTSCTHALEMTALLLGVGPGDEVIVPSFTFAVETNGSSSRISRRAPERSSPFTTPVWAVRWTCSPPCARGTASP